jgi:hypothetical protein
VEESDKLFSLLGVQKHPNILGCFKMCIFQLVIESMNRGDWLPGSINFKNNPYFDAIVKINVRAKSL